MIPPVVLTLLSLSADFAIFLIVVLSLNLEVGRTGIAQFGRVLAVQVGAFAVGGLASRMLAWMVGLPFGAEYADPTINLFIVEKVNIVLSENLTLGLGFFALSLILAMIMGAFVGWLASRPAIRLREVYLGMSLLAYGDLLMWVAYNYKPIVGGSVGISVPDPFSAIRLKAGPLGGFYRNVVVVCIMLLIALLVYLVVEKFTKSPFGRTLKMHRDNEVLAVTYGLDLVKTRTISLILGSAFAALAGALYVFYACACTAAAFTKLTWTFWPWAYMMLGGIGNNTGIAVGVLLFLTIRLLITQYRFDVAAALHLPFDPIWVEYTMAGLAMILIVLFRPMGLIPEKLETLLPRGRIENILKELQQRGHQTQESQSRRDAC